MNRRDAIRLLATAAAMPLVPGSAFALLREARSVLGTAPTLRTLNAHQEATVKAMAEKILPRTETPGANDVGACEFIDLILSEWYEESERSRFLAGLGEVDARSQSLFGAEFVACSASQQGDILTALGENLVANMPAVRSPRPARGDWSSRSAEPFYSMLRRLTLTAYYTSEAGATGELHFEVIPEHHDGCAPAISTTEAPKPQ